MISLTLHISELRPILAKYAHEVGYTEEMLYFGFERMFSHWNFEEFRAFLAQEIPDFKQQNVEKILNAATALEERTSIVSSKCARTLFLVTASTVPSASFQDVMLTLLLPVTVTQRPSASMYPLFKELRAWASMYLPHMTERWLIAEPRHDDDLLKTQLSGFDFVNVSGSTDTLNHYREILQEIPECERPNLIAHGHRLSAIAIFHDEIKNLSDQDFCRMAQDASVWDQMGCLSPKILFIECSQAEAMDFARKLTRALDETAKQLPEIPPSTSVMARLNNAFLMAQFEDACLIKAGINHDSILVWPENAPCHPVLEQRTLNIYPVSDAAGSIQNLAPYGQALATFNAISPELRRQAEQAGFNYFCRPGQMQDPPITWFHDGIGTLAPLFKA